jgi:hypothetical protein
MAARGRGRGTWALKTAAVALVVVLGVKAYESRSAKAK